MLVDIFIYVNEKDESKKQIWMLEIHLFISVVSNFVELDNSFQTPEENVLHFLC